MQTGELRHASDTVRDGRVDAAEHHPVDHQLDVLGEHLPPHVEIAVVERLVVAGEELAEPHVPTISRPARPCYLTTSVPIMNG